jgi:Carboxypeptidase regulatory-like domain
MRTFVRLSIAMLGVTVLAPASALAQSAIAGVVRDTSGAVLPGVNVEAASLALIERSRTVVTDAAGQYKIVDLRPGVYTVTFTSPASAPSNARASSSPPRSRRR